VCGLSALSALSNGLCSLNLFHDRDNKNRQLPFKLKFKTVGQAIHRGIHFEVSLAPLLRGTHLLYLYLHWLRTVWATHFAGCIGMRLTDPSCRKYWFSNALDLMRVTKGCVRVA